MTEAPQAKDAPAVTADASFAEIAHRRRGRIRRYFFERPRAMDAVVVLCYVLLALPTIIASIIEGKWLVVGLLLLIATVLIFRRRYPLQVVAAVAVLEVLATVLNPWGSNVSAGLWFALYAVATTRKRAISLVVFGAASLPLSLLYLFMWTSPSSMNTLQDVPENFHLINNIATAVTIMLSNLLATGIGISVRQRREHEAEIAAWAARTTQLGKVTERNRIAREMHDVVAHSLTVMISLSDGAAVVVKKDPDRAGDVLGELSRTGRAALADMRRVLGVLRDDSGRPAPLTPLESGLNLAKLLDGFRTAGLPLHYAHTGPALPADPAFELTVYRIVQESLTNVLRYGRSLSRVDVQVARDGDLVTIDVLDDGRGTREGGDSMDSLGTRQGIAGMRERAGIYAGIVSAGPGKRGGWAVHAELHWNGDKGGIVVDHGVIKILLVDDQPLLRMGFRLILEGEEGFHVVGEASDGNEAVRQVGELQPDVVLMDVRMPTMDGIEATRRISDAGSEARVIILTTFDLDEYAFSGLQAGASAFLLKDVAPVELVHAVRLVASGDAVVAPRVTQRLLETYVRGGSVPGQSPSPHRDPLLDDLTPRETEILTTIAEGLSNAEIAHKFFLSEATVKTHVRRILSKLQLRDRVQVVVYAYETGLVVPSNPDY